MKTYFPRIPINHGYYLFELTNDSQVWALYDDFEYPYDYHIRDDNQFPPLYIELSNVRGFWFDSKKPPMPHTLIDAPNDPMHKEVGRSRIPKRNKK